MNIERKLIALLSSLTLALLIAVAFFGYRFRNQEGGGLNMQAQLDRPDIRAEVMRKLIHNVGGVWDTHNDPQVGRILQANIKGKEFRGALVTSNRFGMRESNYAIPRPKNTVRVALLGDSFVFGFGAKAEDRMGVFLQRYLKERAGPDAPRIEVLHLGASSWNIVSECVYVRRQISLLQPDVVLQVTTSNDLDDTQGVRGFGAMSRFTAQHRDRGDSMVGSNYPQVGLGFKQNHLVHGFDHASLKRYEEARQALAKLDAALARAGAKYCHIFHWSGNNSVARMFLSGDMSDDKVAFLDADFASNRDYWVAEDDRHWNRDGMEVVGKLMYALIQKRNLLPRLTLPAWGEANSLYDDIVVPGLEAASKEPPFRFWLGGQPILDLLDFTRLDAEVASHVHTGVDKLSYAGPYCSLTLKTHPGGQVRVVGKGLPRPEIDGTTVQVAVDGIAAGSFTISTNPPFDVSFPLPELPDVPEYVTVTLTSDDYAYTSNNLQRLVVFRINGIAIQP